jgi:hypothetical protein
MAWLSCFLPSDASLIESGPWLSVQLPSGKAAALEITNMYRQQKPTLKTLNVFALAHSFWRQRNGDGVG